MHISEKEQVDWVVYDGAVSACLCRRCGGALEVRFPIDADVFSSTVRAFVELHSHCPAPAIANQPITEVIQ